MAYTRAQIEAVLISRAGPLMVQAGLNGTTVDGTNASLNDPIGNALRRSGYSVASLSAVTNADLSTVGEADIDQILDLAYLRVLISILSNLDEVDISVGQRSESLSQLANQVQGLIDIQRAFIDAEYSLGLGTLEAGVIQLDFQEKGASEAG